MALQWITNKCVLCLREGELTEEHLIPSSLGGILSINFLCKRCNDKLGRTVIADALKDVRIAIACRQLNRDLPNITEPILCQLPHEVDIYGSKFAADLYKSNRYALTQGPGPDRSLVLRDYNAERHLISGMKKSGMTEAEIALKLNRYRSAQEGELVDLGPFEARKLPATQSPIEMNLSKTKFCMEQLALVMAYEYLACHVNDNVYLDFMQPIRQCIHTGTIDDKFCVIEYAFCDNYAPFHGLAMEQGKPHIVIQIRLFGAIAFRVSFTKLAYNGPRYVYTLQLSTRRHGVEQLKKEGEENSQANSTRS